MAHHQEALLMILPLEVAAMNIFLAWIHQLQHIHLTHHILHRLIYLHGPHTVLQGPHIVAQGLQVDPLVLHTLLVLRPGTSHIPDQSVQRRLKPDWRENGHPKDVQQNTRHDTSSQNVF